MLRDLLWSRLSDEQAANLAEILETAKGRRLRHRHDGRHESAGVVHPVGASGPSGGITSAETLQRQRSGDDLGGDIGEMTAVAAGVRADHAEGAIHVARETLGHHALGLFDGDTTVEGMLQLSRPVSDSLTV